MCARPCSKFWVSSNEKDRQDLCSGSNCLRSYILKMRRKQRDDKSIKKMFQNIIGARVGIDPVLWFPFIEGRLLKAFYLKHLS